MTLDCAVLGFTLRARHWANWQAVRMILSTWFDHLEEIFSYKEVLFKTFCPPMKTSCPHAEKKKPCCVQRYSNEIPIQSEFWMGSICVDIASINFFIFLYLNILFNRCIILSSWWKLCHRLPIIYRDQFWKLIEF